MNNTCPGEKRLKSLIFEAFDELPAPEPARLGRISARLARQIPARQRPRHHWLFWLLLGGSMTAAAWWGGKAFFTTISPGSVLPVQIPFTESATSNHPEAAVITGKQRADHKQASEPHESPVIYQHEQY